MRQMISRSIKFAAIGLFVSQISIWCFTSQVLAQQPVIELWPNGLPSGAKTLSPEAIENLKAKQTAERITYVDSPTLTIYRAKNNPSKTGVVICPGGGYYILAWQHEGIELAEWFNSIGVTAAILKYRVPRRDNEAIHREPMQDVQRAVRIMRQKSDELGLDSNRIGTLGFSAGGHLTVMSGVGFDQQTYEPQDEADKLSCRPDFMCPIYAAYLGENYKDDRAELGSLITVTDRTPPTFMAVTSDDKMRGAQSALLYAKLSEFGVPAELHVYNSGGHGYGIRKSAKPVSKWHHQLEAWLQDIGMLKPETTENK